MGTFGERGERIVLAQYLAGKERQHRAQLAAGDGSADARRTGADVPAPVLEHLFDGGLQHDSEALGVGFCPGSAVHHQDRGVAEIARGLQPGDVVNVGHRRIGQGAQLVYGFADLLRAKRRACRSKPCCCGRGKLPVDQGLGRCCCLACG